MRDFAPIRRLLTFGAVTSAFGLAVAAQTPHFEVGIDDVRVEVSVTVDGTVLTGLGPNDFTVRDEGEVREVLAFDEASLPLDMVLLLDLNGRMHRDLRGLAESADAALEELRHDDRVAVASFSTIQRLDEAFTLDKVKAAAAVRRATAEVIDTSGVHLIRALEFGLRLLEANPRREPSRWALLMITDNIPSPGLTPDSEILPKLAERDAVVHAIVVTQNHLGSKRPRPRDYPGHPYYASENIFHIASATGGDALLAKHSKDRFAELIRRIRSRYTLWFRANRDNRGVYRRIRVSLSDAALRKHPNARVRAREGYYTPAE